MALGHGLQLRRRLCDRGDVTRTTDGGRSWQNVWSRDGSQKTVVNGTPETLTAVDSQTAYVAAVIPPVRDGTYIVTYHARRWPELAVDAGAADAALNACAEPEEP